MGTMILISTVAMLVGIVGCFVIWRLDASRADEIEHMAPPHPAGGAHRAVAGPGAAPVLPAIRASDD